MGDELAWPDDKWSVFSRSNAASHSPTWCSIDWLIHSSVDESFLSVHFKEAADHIIARLRSGDFAQHPDGLFMPVAYLYRHSLELILKHLVRLGIAAQVIEDSPKLQKHLIRHDLADLWEHACTAIGKMWPDGDTRTVNNTTALIRDFQRLDKSGQSLRYVRDRRNQPTIERYPRSIDLGELQSAFAGIHNLLSSCAQAIADSITHTAGGSATEPG